MKFKRVESRAILPTDKNRINIHALESVRLEPSECKIVRTGIFFEDLPEGYLLSVNISRKLATKRPFIMASDIFTSEDEGHEITLVFWNRSTTIPAVIDQGELIAEGVLLKHYTGEESTRKIVKKTTK